MIILQDGTTHSSVNVSLTIHSLTSADEGSYTCRGPTGVQKVTQLTVDTGTPPPITLPPITTSTPTIGGVLLLHDWEASWEKREVFISQLYVSITCTGGIHYSIIQ